MAGKATGERIEARKKHRVIELASLGEPTNKIAKTVKLGWRTVAAIKALESQTIAERKRIMADQFAEIAMLGAERLKREVLTLPAGSLIPAVGMSCDKVLSLTQDPTTISNTLHVHLNKVDVIGEFNETLSKLGLLKNGSGNAQQNASTGNASSAEKQIQGKIIESGPLKRDNQDQSAG